MRRWHIGEAPSVLQLNEIASVLKGGAVVLMPTDTIYGLHALATSEEAVERIVELKGREEAKPFIVLAATAAQLVDLGIDASAKGMEALTSVWPAPLTAILPLSRPIAASRGASSLAVRIPAVEWLRVLLERTGPLVSTSANRSGEPPVEHPSALAEALQDHLDIVDGGVRNGEPSAILDLTGVEPRFIRESDPVFTQKLWKTLRNSL